MRGCVEAAVDGWCSQADSSGICHLRNRIPRGFSHTRESWSPWWLCCVEISGVTRCVSGMTCCPGLCGCMASPRAFYLQPYWNHSDLNLLGVILSHLVLGRCWQALVGAVSRTTVQGSCVGPGAEFQYLTLSSLSWLKVHSWTPELSFLQGISGAGLSLLRVHVTASVFQNKWLQEIIPFQI